MIGLTWDHPRGSLPLEAAAASASLPLTWHRQPLEGFESHPIEELSRAYDLLVIDHPHVGDAAESGALRAVDDLLCVATRAIGRSSESYRYRGRSWALALDASAQVGVARPEALADPPPETWDDALALAGRVPTTIPLGGPHALLALFAIAAAHGDPPGRGPHGRLFDGDGARKAWETLAQLVERCDPESWEESPIVALERIARGQGPVWSPLVFAYVTYASPGDGRVPLSFHDAPAAACGGEPGSILGGTGLALSAARPLDERLVAHAAELVSTFQTTVIPAAGGQPAALAAWQDPKLDGSARGFYSAIRRTLEHAVVRPRFPGFVPFQSAASEAVRRALRARVDARAALADLERLYARHRPAGAEI